MPRPRNTHTRRAEIVQGLAEVMAQRGYAGASVAAIAAQAGLSTGLVHYHFKHKRAILLALVASLAEQILARFEARSADLSPRVPAALNSDLDRRGPVFESKARGVVLVARQRRATPESKTGTGEPGQNFGRQVLDAAVDALMGLEAGDPVAAACWARIGAEAHGQPEVAQAYTAALAQVQRHLVRAFEAAGADDAEVAARALMLAIEGAWRVGHGAPSLLPTGSAAPTLRALAHALAQ